jgi:subtilisin-like proprotein convertase family protein
MPTRIQSRFILGLVLALSAALLWSFAGAKDHAYTPQKDNGKRVAVQSPVARPVAPSALDESFASTHDTLQIPDGPNGVLIDSIVVTQNITINDLDIQVDITHAWVRDLTIVLRHVPQSGEPKSAMLLDLFPAGFIQNLTGTWFSDEAGEWILLGHPPFTGDFRPMQPLSVFDGQSAAGIWYLEVRDRFLVDSGTLNSWTLEVNHPDMLSGIVQLDTAEPHPVPRALVEVLDTIPITDSTYSIEVIQQLYTRGNGAFAFPRLPAGDYGFRISHPFTDSLTIPTYNIVAGTEVAWNVHSDHRFVVVNLTSPLAIPDNNTGGVSCVLPVSDFVTDAMDVVDVEIAVDATHPFIGDLSMKLRSGANEEMNLVSFNPNNDGANLLDCRFDDEAEFNISQGDVPYTGSWLPESPLSVFDGDLSAGNWTLKIIDNGAGDFGTIDRAELTVVYNEVGTITGHTKTGRGLGVPVVGVEVSVAGTGISDCTNQDGAFTLLKVPAGNPVLEFNHQLYRFGQAWPVVAFGDTVLVEAVLTPAYAAPTVFTASEPFDIIDADSVRNSADTTQMIFVTTPVFDTLQVSSANLIVDLNVILNINHAFLGELNISLFSPDSTEINLTIYRPLLGETTAFINTRFDDESCDYWYDLGSDTAYTGTWAPSQSLSAFDNMSALGPWTLKVVDNRFGDAGTVQSWKLEFLFEGDLLDTPPAAVSIPEDFTFHGNFPNPFNPSTTFAFDLNRAVDVQLVVYNLLGQQVAQLVNGKLEAGAHTISFDASGLASGVYLARLSTPTLPKLKRSSC